jgi:hypothetical protein
MSDQAKDVEAVFMAALDKPTPQERRGFVDGVCRNNPELRQQL